MKRSASLVVPLVNIGLAMSQENAANALAIVSRRYGERRVAHVDDVRVGFGLHELLHALGSVVDDRFVYGCHRATVQMIHIRVVLDQHANYVSSVSLLFFVYCLFITLFNLHYHVFNELMSMSMIWTYDFHVVLFLFLRGLFSTDLIGLRFKSLNHKSIIKFLFHLWFYLT